MKSGNLAERFKTAVLKFSDAVPRRPGLSRTALPRNGRPRCSTSKGRRPMPRVPGRPESRKHSVNRHGQLDPPPSCPYLKKTIRLLSTLGNILSLRSKGDAILRR